MRTPPHWTNVISSQVALADAVRRRLTFESPKGKPYRPNEGRLATLVVRPRGWHLDERHILVDGKPTVGAFVYFGLYLVSTSHRRAAIAIGGMAAFIPSRWDAEVNERAFAKV
jgi:malate synthase